MDPSPVQTKKQELEIAKAEESLHLLEDFLFHKIENNLHKNSSLARYSTLMTGTINVKEPFTRERHYYFTKLSEILWVADFIRTIRIEDSGKKAREISRSILRRVRKIEIRDMLIILNINHPLCILPEKELDLDKILINIQSNITICKYIIPRKMFAKIIHCSSGCLKLAIQNCEIDICAIKINPLTWFKTQTLNLTNSRPLGFEVWDSNPEKLIPLLESIVACKSETNHSLKDSLEEISLFPSFLSKLDLQNLNKVCQGTNISVCSHIAKEMRYQNIRCDIQ
ncbi:unnamed protein product [Moneuplotes crassus]|uniref:Uncharacterized protein n=1 Tax=Euplotes crassus TaxID=5936 RepID=A0AAD1XRX9_EUPCR|nr:unnamed protein product [Moneuplotes crassus]